MKSIKKHLQGILLVTLGVALYLSGTVQAAQPGAPLRFTPTSTLGEQSRHLAGSELDDIRHPGLPNTLRVLAIRVDFQSDTLSTTTGDGSFFYELPDTVDAEDWLIDPPPHDKAYFEDQFLGLKNYYERFSHGELTIVGDIYPAANQAAYRMPYPIWHINYGDTTEAGFERLNQTLTQLFIDSWQAADSDLVAAGVDYSQYDYFVIFHAGAGNEFDTGYDTTPHDIPSVYIGPQDLLEYSDYPNGVELGNSFILDRGVILPEMQRQGDVEVGLLGTICAQVGFLMGMPHLYQAETGDPGIGLFGLMDRGFGGFFGIIPSPPSAWMRYYMGWEDAVEITDGPIRLGVLQLPDSVFHDSLHRLVKVPLNDNEYYLLEARRRDPQEEGQVWYDSTYALDAPDANGNQDTLVLRYDYSFDLLHEGTDFGVPVWIEDQDFDLPASGILIWHIDERLIRAGLADDRIQTSKEQRGVKLIEADGSWDIGEEYAFLTAGDGSEYGVIDDAFFADNEIWPEANPGMGHDIFFGSETAPATVTSDGLQTHILFDNFSNIADTMRCRVGNEWKQGDFPTFLPFPYPNNYPVRAVPCDVDGDGINEIFFGYGEGEAYVFDGEGTQLYHAQLSDPEFVHAWPVADLNGDGRDEVVAVGIDYVTILTFESDGTVSLSGRALANMPDSPATDLVRNAMIVGPESDPHLVFRCMDEGGVLGLISLSLLNTTADPATFWLTDIENANYASTFAVQVGSASSDTVAYVTSDGTLYVLTADQLHLVSDVDGFATHAEVIGSVVSADFDGDGVADIAATIGTQMVYWFGSEQYSYANVYDLGGFYLGMIPLDIDHDGLVEFTGLSLTSRKIEGFEPTGILSEGAGLQISNKQSILSRADFYWMDGSSRGDNELLTSFSTQDLSSTLWKETIDAFTMNNSRERLGFPLQSVYGPQVYGGTKLILTQLDQDDNPELVLYGEASNRIQVFNLPISSGQPPIIHWGMEGGNAQGTYSLRTTPAGGSSRTGLDASAYCWPNPVLNGDDAHFRFRAKSGGTASVRVFDMVGREMMYKEQGIEAGLDEEIVLSTRDLASGVYAARLEAGGEYKIIRFAVVK